MLGVAVAELFFGGLLLFLPRLSLGRVGCAILSASFLGASSVGFMLTVHCPCFGDHHVSPGDRLLIALLLFIGVLLSSSLVFGGRAWLLIAGVMIVSFVAGAFVEASPLSRLVEQELSSTALGNMLPPELQKGTWRVTAIRADCPSCLEYLSQRAATWRRAKRGNLQPGRVLLVLGRHRNWIDRYSGMFDRHFTIPDSQDFLFATPVQFEVSSGRVTSEPLFARGVKADHGI